MKTLKPEHITAITDTREQRPFFLDPMKSEPGTLQAGDYSVKGLTDLIAVERKSLPDLVGCMTNGRERFERELQRLRGYSSKVVVIESNWMALVHGSYRSKLNSAAACHTIVSWTAKYSIPFLFLGDRQQAEDFTRYFLFSAVKRIYEYLHIPLGDMLKSA
jgi:DNA excision repair protein ERCC-4